jgi:uncharacterized protein (TIGR00369 family)
MLESDHQYRARAAGFACRAAIVPDESLWHRYSQQTTQGFRRMTASPPDGFQLFPVDGFIANQGPYYFRDDAATGAREFRFLSDQRHANPNGVLHGGATVGFLDTMLGNAVWRQTGRNCATISMESRFVASAKPGVWITGRTTIKRIARTIAFADAEAFAGDTLLVTVAAVFKVFEV